MKIYGLATNAVMPPEPHQVGRASAFRQFLKTKKLNERKPRNACFSAVQRGPVREEKEMRSSRSNIPICDYIKGVIHVS